MKIITQKSIYFLISINTIVMLYLVFNGKLVNFYNLLSIFALIIFVIDNILNIFKLEKYIVSKFIIWDKNIKIILFNGRSIIVAIFLYWEVVYHAELEVNFEFFVKIYFILLIIYFLTLIRISKEKN